jgi:hypothetical protein
MADIQILYRIDPVAALPPTPAKGKRLAPPLPCQRAFLLFHDHFYPNGA